MLLKSKVSSFVLILVLLGTSKCVVASEKREDEYLLSTKRPRPVELEEGISAKKSKSDRIIGRIDRLATAFEKYDTLSVQEQRELREKYSIKVTELDNELGELHLRVNFFQQNVMISSSSMEEYTITKETKGKLEHIKSLYQVPKRSQDCSIF